jgi:hypothetical protein
MNLTEIIITGCVLAAIGLICLWWALITAHDLEKEEHTFAPKFQPRKVVDLSAPTSINLAKKDVTPVSTKEALAPKKKKKRYYNKKKKPAVANSAPTEKRPVGRPRKVQ